MSSVKGAQTPAPVILLSKEQSVGGDRPSTRSADRKKTAKRADLFSALKLLRACPQMFQKRSLVANDQRASGEPVGKSSASDGFSVKATKTCSMPDRSFSCVRGPQRTPCVSPLSGQIESHVRIPSQVLCRTSFSSPRTVGLGPIGVAHPPLVSTCWATGRMSLGAKVFHFLSSTMLNKLVSRSSKTRHGCRLKVKVSMNSTMLFLSGSRTLTISCISI